MQKTTYVLVLLAFLSITSIATQAEEGTESANTTENVREQRLENLRESRKASIEAHMTDRKARIEQKHNELKEDLLAIKNARKQKIVENLDIKLDEMNARRTGHFDLVLTKLEEILAKLRAHVVTAQEAGKDTAAADASIAAATIMIDTAREQVEAQAAKEYTPEVGEESALRSIVGLTVSQLRADLKTVFNAVKTARDGVRTAAQQVKLLKVLQENDAKRNTATTSATQ